MIIQHNITAMNANRQLGITQGQLQKSTEKLSSGYDINRAGDNAAGLAISEKMRGQIRGLNQASTNAEDGISLVQTAEGALQETQNILQRMRELAVQSANDTNTDDDRTQIQKEITQLTNEIDRIATTSEFNTKKLLDGSVAGAQKLEYGSASVDGTFTNGMVSIQPISDATAQAIGVDDVIRLVALTDYSSTDVTLVSDVASDGSTTGFSVQTLNGTSVESVSEEGITIACSYGDKENILAENSPEETVTFAIQNMESIKAGDVITISLKAAKPTEPAERNKDSIRLQVGANSAQEIELGIKCMKASALNIVKTSTTGDGTEAGEALDVSSQASASLAIEAYDKALQDVSTERAKLGAIQNRLEHTIANLDTSEENLQASESRIRDTDMADEMTLFSKNNILQQAGTSMLAQANQANQTVLSLLG